MADDGSEPEGQHIRPVIEELVRTQHCGNPLSLLLDKINIVASDAHSNGEDAYRLWLSDGTKVIQGVLMHDLHPFLNAGDVCEGSLLVLTKYQLVRATRRTRKGWIWIIAVLDMQVNGHDGRQITDVEIETGINDHEPSKGIIRAAGKVRSNVDLAGESVQSPRKKRKSTAEDEDWQPIKRKKGTKFFSSPLKPKPRSVLGETSTNSPSRTPTKVTKSVRYEDTTGSDPLPQSLSTDYGDI